MKATSPGEYIHMITIELSTLKDGKVIMFLSVDGYSRYCFSNAVISPLTFEKLVDHLDTIIVELRKHHPELVPTFIMGYGEDMQFKLELHYKGIAHFRFSKALADEVALPVAENLLKHVKLSGNA